MLVSTIKRIFLLFISKNNGIRVNNVFNLWYAENDAINCENIIKNYRLFIEINYRKTYLLSTRRAIKVR